LFGGGNTRMELPGANFFYAIATVAMTFSGFSAIVVTLRQGTGGRLSPLHILFTRFFIECGLMVTFFAIVPPLLALSGITEANVWRGSSLIVLAIAIPYCYYYPKRRRRAAPTEKVPLRFYVLLWVGLSDYAALIANVIGWPFAPNSFPIAFFLVYLLFAGAFIFLATYSLFLASDRNLEPLGVARNTGSDD
jgi:hypothetical protein